MAAPAAKRMKGTTAYMLFGEEQRPSITAKLRADAPDGKVAVTVVAKAIGELWKALSDEEKASYKEKAQARAIGKQ
jgi:DNA-directed RNA polymerase I subunit RPA43